MATLFKPRSETKPRIGLYWVTNDLRLEDNPILQKTSEQVDQLVCIHILDPLLTGDHKGPKEGHVTWSSMSHKRRLFLYEALDCFDRSLYSLGQQLYQLQGPPSSLVKEICESLGVTHIYRSQNAGWYENWHWNKLKTSLPNIEFNEFATHTLYSEDELPFDLSALPGTFSKFRKLVEPLENVQPLPRPSLLPALPAKADDLIAGIARRFRKGQDLENEAHKPESNRSLFSGGEAAGLKHLKRYMWSGLPSNYKEVRNSLDGWDNSTKFSPWLANGNLSVKTLLFSINHYEQERGANDSTYWIVFELLWREYFQWYAHRYQEKLFALRGIKNQTVLTSFYGERFQRWCQGNTPYPLVNACMKELNQTGFMSNRGRQIVASCFVNELDLDWRYGAAYFERQLLDYDVGSNWGNWQYIAGVGADTVEKRHFNIEKQTQQYDPNGSFRKKWQAESASDTLDSVDASDWPIA